MELQQLISILKASFDAGLLIDDSGSIMYVNTAARAFLGMDLENNDLGNVDTLLAFHPGDNKDNKSFLLWKDMKQTSEKETFLVVSKHEKNSKSAEARVAHVGEYTLLFCSPQKELQSQIEKERNIIKGILDASLDPLFQTNEKGVIQRVNKAATAQFGWSKQEFIGNNISMIVGKQHAVYHDDYMKRYLETGEARVMGTKRVLPARRKDGSEFMIQLSLVEVETEVGDERLFCGFVVMDLPGLDDWLENDPCKCCCWYSKS